MLVSPAVDQRELKTISHSADLVIVGGGLAGTCAAVTAARAGLKVVLVQDRPVLGGNASSEVRLWILGATAHMSNNNRWAREGGVVDEILIENMYRNREGNPIFVDALLLELVTREPNITLLLNTAVYEASKSDPDTIASVRAFCPQNSTQYDLHAPLFCDCSGDGILGFLSGAAFRMGAESADEFGEKFAPDQAYGELLGHSIYFYSKDAGRPVKFVPPSFALTDITKIPRYKNFNTKTYGCRLWWMEFGGRLDTVHETETIKWELWKVAYGVWNHIKNSGQFPEAENLTLEWIGTIPGKRESRRFEGDYMIIQQDVIEQRQHADAVGHGGWSIDLHPADGVYSPRHGCDQWHAKGLYQIPYRSLYSKNIRNLFLAGRTISASHVAFGSTRVMATCAVAGQAVAMAAAICRRDNVLPRELSSGDRLKRLQRDLIRVGQHIPQMPLQDDEDLAKQATITASSTLALAALPPGGPGVVLQHPWAMMLPVSAGAMPTVTFVIDVQSPVAIQADLMISSKPDNHTPDVTLASRTIAVPAGKSQALTVAFNATIDGPRYAFVALRPAAGVSVQTSETRVSGVLSVHTTHGQHPTSDIGVDDFEFWRPARRPGGQNFAITIDPPLRAFEPANLTNGIARPTNHPNAWVADVADKSPSITLNWSTPQTIGRIELTFDCDYDHPAESVLWGQPEDIMPFCVRRYRIKDESGRVLHECEDNHQTRSTIRLKKPIQARRVTLEVEHPSPTTPAAVFEVRCYAD